MYLLPEKKKELKIRKQAIIKMELVDMKNMLNKQSERSNSILYKKR